MQSILLTSLIISLFCCGWQVVTSEHQLLYFLRVPFIKLKDNYEGKIADVILYVFKPVILCITCFASFWGVIIYFILHNTLSIETIICCIISAFLNNVLYFGYTKFIQD